MSSTDAKVQAAIDLIVGSARYPRCARCVYGDPVAHTCDPEQARKHDLLLRGERGTGE